MRKYVEPPVTALPEPEQKAEDQSALKIAEALAANSQTSLMAIQVTQILNDSIRAELGGHAQALDEIVSKITATREVEVEVTGHDENGRIKTLKIVSRLPKTLLH